MIADPERSERGRERFGLGQGMAARRGASRCREHRAKYYVPSVGGFIIYAVMVVTLVLRPQGLFARGDGR